MNLYVQLSHLSGAIYKISSKLQRFLVADGDKNPNPPATGSFPLIWKNVPDYCKNEVPDKNNVTEFKEYLAYPNIILINNTSITQDKDLGLVIKDKYNLCNINLTTEDLDLNNIDKLMDNVNVLYNENNIRKSNLSFEDIKFYIQAKSILEKNDD